MWECRLQTHTHTHTHTRTHTHNNVGCSHTRTHTHKWSMACVACVLLELIPVLWLQIVDGDSCGRYFITSGYIVVRAITNQCAVAVTPEWCSLKQVHLLFFCQFNRYPTKKKKKTFVERHIWWCGARSNSVFFHESRWKLTAEGR